MMDRDRLTEEILRFLDGQMAPDEERTLAAAIRADEEAQKLFAELMRLDGSVASVLTDLKSQMATEHELKGAPTPPGGVSRIRRMPQPARRSNLGWILGIAGAIAAVLLIMVAIPTGDAPERRPTVAQRPVKPIEAETPVVRETPRPPEPEKPKEVPVPKPVPPIEEPKPASKPPAPLEVPLPAPAPKPEPKPEPKPDPKPEPKPEPAAPTRVAELPPAVVAVVDKVKGEVLLVDKGTKSPATERQQILAGQGIEVGAGESLASLKFTDGTFLEIGPETILTEVAEVIPGKSGKKVAMTQGVITASVTKQPAAFPMVLTTPQAEARVLGTKFTLTVKNNETRLEVREGRVRLTRTPDGPSTDIYAGNFTVASPAIRPASKKIPPPRRVFETNFDEGGGIPAGWQRFPGGFPTTTKGALEINVSPKGGTAYQIGGWHDPGGLRSKEGFAIPFRLTMDVEITHKHPDINALIVFQPKSGTGTRNTTGALPNELAVRLRGIQYGLLIEGDRSRGFERDVDWPTASHKERWIIEVDAREVRLTAGGKEIGSKAHGLKITEEYVVELQGTAKFDNVPDARIRYDNIKIGPPER